VLWYLVLTEYGKFCTADSSNILRYDAVYNNITKEQLHVSTTNRIVIFRFLIP
jgi:hypothetical protein